MFGLVQNVVLESYQHCLLRVFFIGLSFLKQMKETLIIVESVDRGQVIESITKVFLVKLVPFNNLVKF